MIICHSEKFVLIRPRKVASSSVQWAFLPHLADQDLVMGLDLSDLANPVPTRAKVGHHRNGWPLTLRAHSPLSRLIQVMGEDLLRYRLITLARNPWDRAVSEFYYVNRETDMASRPVEEQKAAFTRFVREVSSMTVSRHILDRLEGRHRRCKMEQAELCTYKGQFMADHVIFFEKIADGITQVGQAIGLDLQLPSQKAKGKIRAKASRDWRAFYTDETRELVAQSCRNDIRLYGYDFEGAVVPDYRPVAREVVPARRPG